MERIDEGPMQGNSDWIDIYSLDPDLLDVKPICDARGCVEDAKYFVTTKCCNEAEWFCREDIEVRCKAALRQGHNNQFVTCEHCGKRIHAKGSLSNPHKL